MLRESQEAREAVEDQHRSAMERKESMLGEANARIAELERCVSHERNQRGKVVGKARSVRDCASHVRGTLSALRTVVQSQTSSGVAFFDECRLPLGRALDSSKSHALRATEAEISLASATERAVAAEQAAAEQRSRVKQLSEELDHLSESHKSEHAELSERVANAEKALARRRQELEASRQEEVERARRDREAGETAVEEVRKAQARAERECQDLVQQCRSLQVRFNIFFREIPIGRRGRCLLFAGFVHSGNVIGGVAFHSTDGEGVVGIGARSNREGAAAVCGGAAAEGRPSREGSTRYKGCPGEEATVRQPGECRECRGTEAWGECLFLLGNMMKKKPS